MRKEEIRCQSYRLSRGIHCIGSMSLFGKYPRASDLSESEGQRQIKSSAKYQNSAIDVCNRRRVPEPSVGIQFLRAQELPGTYEQRPFDVLSRHIVIRPIAKGKESTSCLIVARRRRLGICQPAVLHGIVVHVILYGLETLSPVHVRIAEDLVCACGSAEHFVGVRNVIWKADQRRDGVKPNQGRDDVSSAAM